MFKKILVVLFGLAVASNVSAWSLSSLFGGSNDTQWVPPKTVNIVVGQSTGGGNEFAVRGVWNQFEQNTGSKITLVRKPGLDNVVAMNYFAEQNPDGQHLLSVVQATGFVAAPVAYPTKLNGDPMNYVPVITIAKAPMAFVVPFDSPFKTPQDLIDYLKADSNNTLNFGLSGSINLLTYSYFLNKIGISTEQAKAVKYQSPSKASLGAAAHNIDVAVVPLSVPRSLVQSEKVRILGHTGANRIATLDADIMKDYVPGLEIEASWSLFLPPGTNQEIADWYHAEILKAMESDEAQNYYTTAWAVTDTSTTKTSDLYHQLVRLRDEWMPTAHAVIQPQK